MLDYPTRRMSGERVSIDQENFELSNTCGIDRMLQTGLISWKEVALMKESIIGYYLNVDLQPLVRLTLPSPHNRTYTSRGSPWQHRTEAVRFVPERQAG